MNTNCFEIGTIQAFLDGETTADQSLRLTDHVASCDACARLLAEAEEENSVVFSALDRELNTLVPTQRLWSRINETIAVEKSNVSVWQKILVYVRASIANPSIAMAAGIILVVGMLGVLWIPKSSDSNVAFVNPPPLGPTQTEVVDITGGDQFGGPETASAPGKTPNTALQVKESNYSPQKLRQMMTTADYRRPVQAPTVIPASANAYLPGEESYVRTISDLKQSVDSQKDDVMSPSNRIAYERDMAVVNDSIQRMREVVRKNPRNQAARQVLYSSYQDKIDLLNSVAQREELMASLR